MNPKGLGTDLVDRNVDVLVICIVMTHRNVLALGKPQRIHKPVHNTFELRSFEAPIARVKGNDEVIRPLAACPRVLCLDGIDELAGEFEVVCSAHPWQIYGVEPGCSRLGAS